MSRRHHITTDILSLETRGFLNNALRTRNLSLCEYAYRVFASLGSNSRTGTAYYFDHLRRIFYIPMIEMHWAKHTTADASNMRKRRRVAIKARHSSSSEITSSAAA